MAPLRRPAREEKLYRLHFEMKKHVAIRRLNRVRRAQWLLREHPVSTPAARTSLSSDLDSLSSFSTDISSSASAWSTDSFWDDDSMLTSSASLSLIPSVPSMPQNTDESDSDSDSDVSMHALMDLDDDSEESDDEGSDDEDGKDRWSRLRKWIQRQVDEMYAHRYEEPRDILPRGPAHLPHLLHNLKHTRPEKFREELRVTPATFDALVERLEPDPVFSNNSCNSQIPVEDQLAIALYRFGHDGDAASVKSIANWSGYAVGTVVLCTRRVITAVLRPGFRHEAIRLPKEQEKEVAKQWVEDHSCKGWRGGWCFVDGTLVPLYGKPKWCGENYLDRKSRYSLNVQIVNLPNLRIIDFSYGHFGSTHDAIAWESTELAQQHDGHLDAGEWIWADSAYPISTWIVAPYKRPDSNLPNNDTFNNHVSMVRIRSEHAIGYLKGRFHSLKNLRLSINSLKDHKFATNWVTACICIHSWAVQHEEDERDSEARSHDFNDPFIAEGLSSSSDVSDVPELPEHLTQSSRAQLLAGKAYREELKAKLLEAKAKRARTLALQRHEQFGVYNSDSEDSE